ncbi:MAG: hypothetical protein NTU53_13810 [Planctomycetota bacterium]|nr:hypothetical protein [Planctomycetota bacterium]
MRTTSTIAILALITLLATPAPAQIKFTPIALSGQPAPGVPGAVYHYFDDASLNTAGQIAFTARTALPQAPQTATGLWTGSPGSLQLLAHTGFPSPSIEGATLQGIGSPQIDPAGSVLFHTYCTLPGKAFYGSWAGFPGALEGIGLPSTPAPDPVGGTFDWTYVSSRSPSAQITFTSCITKQLPDDTTEYIYAAFLRSRPGAYQLIARSGDHVSGTSSTTLIGPSLFHTGYVIEPPAVNAAQQMAFSVNLNGPDVESSNDRALVLAANGSLQLIARSGDPAPTPGFPVRYDGFGAPELTNTGLLVFTGTLQTPDSYVPTEPALFAGHPGDIQALAFPGMDVPGISGARFSRVNDFRATPDGRITFYASMAGDNIDYSNDGSLWISSDDQLRLIARDGDVVPGTDALHLRIGRWFVNDSGQLVFGASLSNQDLTTFDSAIFTTDPAGNLVLIARAGDPLDLGDGAPRTIQYLTPFDFSNTGQLAMTVTFSDGSTGLFIATVPEPATPIALALISLAMLRPSRAHRLQEKHP